MINVQNNLASAGERISGLEGSLKAIQDDASVIRANIRSIAEALGVPLGNPKELEKLIEERRLYEAAKREGKVVLYTTVDVRVAEAIKAGFERKYPGITVEIVRGGPDALARRFVSEFDRGVPYADVLHIGDYAAFFLVEKRRLMRYTPFTADWLPVQYRDPDGYWYTDRVILNGICYNTRAVSAQEAPKSYTELLDPKWTGRIATSDIRLTSVPVNLFVTLEKMFGTSFVEQLAKQKIAFFGTSFVDAIGRVVAGEFSLTLSAITLCEPRRIAGDPIDWVRFADNRYISFRPWNAIPANAPNPNAAKLLLNYLFTLEGQQILADAGHQPLHPQVRFANPDMSPANKQIIFIETLTGDALAAATNKYVKLFIG
ncbi:MAG: ABC transporter substrate-binding protein [Nitrososphaerota archaeon]|nr:ABC transporter substrate-binding protein [Nitrososphaerota archaeon]